MRIDSHIHFWRIARGDNAISPDSPLHRDHEPEELKPLLERAGIDRIVVVQAAATHAENLYTIGLAQRFSVIAGVVAWIDPASPALKEEIAALRATGCVKGFRPVRDENSSIAWMLQPELARGYEAMATAGMPMDVLIENPDELPVVEILARTHPHLRIVLDHCGKPDVAGERFEPWARDLAAIARHRNTVCKFSGLLGRAPRGAQAAQLQRYADHVFDRFGADRLMWASDWPPLSRVAAYDRWIDVSADLMETLSASDRSAIHRDTASRAYGL